MNDEPIEGTSQLKYLSEFRFELRKFLSFSETASERHGVAAQQYQLIQVIGALSPGQRASISYLAERMILRHNSAVELVDRAERAGLVRRDIDEDDLRRSIVQLTPKGSELLKVLVDEHLQELEERGHRIQDALAHLYPSLQRANGKPEERNIVTAQ